MRSATADSGEQNVGGMGLIAEVAHDIDGQTGGSGQHMAAARRSVSRAMARRWGGGGGEVYLEAVVARAIRNGDG